MNKLFKGLRTILYWVSVVSMALMLVIISSQVLTRYAFGYSAEWAEEAARFLFVWTVFIGSALIMGENGHLAVELVIGKFKGKPLGIVLEIFIKFCSYLFVLILITQGYKMTTTMMFQKSPGLDIPMGWVYAIVPVSAVLMLLYLIRDTAQFFRSLKGENSDKT